MPSRLKARPSSKGPANKCASAVYAQYFDGADLVGTTAGLGVSMTFGAGMISPPGLSWTTLLIGFAVGYSGFRRAAFNRRLQPRPFKG